MRNLFNRFYNLKESDFNKLVFAEVRIKSIMWQDPNFIFYSQGGFN